MQKEARLGFEPRTSIKNDFTKPVFRPGVLRPGGLVPPAGRRQVLIGDPSVLHAQRIATMFWTQNHTFYSGVPRTVGVWFGPRRGSHLVSACSPGSICPLAAGSWRISSRKRCMMVQRSHQQERYISERKQEKSFNCYINHLILIIQWQMMFTLRLQIRFHLHSIFYDFQELKQISLHVLLEPFALFMEAFLLF